jgi:hypothetical protein
LYSFYTFCVERGEHVSVNPPTWYDIAGIDTTSHVSGTRALSGYSAWVYEKFLAKVALEGFDPHESNDNRVIAGDYQEMIWAGMLTFDDADGDGSWDSDELFTADVGGAGSENEGVDLEADRYDGFSYAEFLDDEGWWGDELGDNPTDTEKLSVTKLYRVINLQTADGSVAQDMTILTQEPVSGVPEPASLLIWSFLGLAGVSLWSRRGRESLPQRWSRRDREAIYSLIDHGKKA